MNRFLDAEIEAFKQDRPGFSSEIDRLDTAVEQAQSEKQKAVEALDAEREAHRQTREELQKARDLAKEQAQELGALRAKIKQDDQAELRKIGERLEQLEQRLPTVDAEQTTTTTTAKPDPHPEKPESAKATRKSTRKPTPRRPRSGKPP